MEIDNLLSIGSFACSVLSLIVSLWLVRENKKLTAVIVIICAVVITTGISVCRWWKHDVLIEQVKKEIVETVTHDGLTFDELHQNLLYKSFPVINEALFLLVESKEIRHRLLRIKDKGRMVSVRVYCKKISKQ